MMGWMVVEDEYRMVWRREGMWGGIGDSRKKGGGIFECCGV
jgi:hypothetical protein